MTGSWSSSDADGDAFILNQTGWYKNNVEQTALENLTALSSGNTTVGEVWIFSFRTYDGYEWSAYSNSTNITIRKIWPTTYANLTDVSDSDADGNIELSWINDTTESNETYRIYRYSSKINSSNIGSSALIASGVKEGAQFYEDNATLNGTAYWYALVTVNEQGIYNESVLSISLNATANDTMTPKSPTNLNVTSSGATATLMWSDVANDVNGNADFYGLQYVIYYGTNFNSSKALANESIASFSTATATTNSTTISVISSGTYHFVVTAIDDADNKNLTLDIGENYGNATLTYTPGNDGNGGGGGGGGSGGGGGGAAQTSVTESGDIICSRSFTLLRPDEFQYLTCNNQYMPISRAGISSKSSLVKPTLRVTKFANSTAPFDELDKIIYAAFEINFWGTKRQTIPNIYIGKTEIKFGVNKNWLSDYSADYRTISMYRHDSSWKKIKTALTNEDNEKYYFESNPDGFSYFAIAAEKKTVAEIEDANKTITEEEEKPANKTIFIEEPGPIIEDEPKKPSLLVSFFKDVDFRIHWPVFTFIILIGLMADIAVKGTAYFVRKPRKKGLFSLKNWTEKPEKQFLKEGRIYLIKEKGKEESFNLFQRLTKSRKGLAVVRENPKTISYKSKNIVYVWLSTKKEKDCINPSDIEDLYEEITSFLSENEGIVLLQGIDNLIRGTSFSTLIHTLTVLKDEISDKKNIILVSYNPAIFDKNQHDKIESEFEIAGRGDKK